MLKRNTFSRTDDLHFNSVILSLLIHHSTETFNSGLPVISLGLLILICTFQRPATITGFIIGSYLLISYLELSIAALIEFIAQTLWPISHAILLLIERLSINFGSFMHSSDDIMRVSILSVQAWTYSEKAYQIICKDN